MPMKIQKYLQDYLHKIKKPNTSAFHFFPKSWILSACKRPRTSSFRIRNDADTSCHNHVDISAKLSDIDQFLAENFKSLYSSDEADDPDPKPSSLVEVSRSSSSSGRSATVPEQCVAVLAYSPEPAADFRRSMREVVEARLRRGESVDWGFVEEILVVYLNLNDKKFHEFVLSAFVDLVVDLRAMSELRRTYGERAINIDKVSLS